MVFRRESVSARPPAPGRRELASEVASRLAAASEAATVPHIDRALTAIAARRGLGWSPDALHRLALWIHDELTGLGPVGPLVRDPGVTEVMINSAGEVFVERNGRLERARVRFRSDEDVRHLIERIVGPLGLRVDASAPWVDARLPDGSRLHAIVPPVAVRGPAVTIRTFAAALWTLDDLVAMGSVRDADACAIADAVRGRRNLLVCGGAATGKTTLLGVIARLIPPEERVITIEDAAELRLGPRHVVSLETRPPNVEGRGEVSMRDLVRCAMRMRPDRIVIGEVRGPEALDMLQALNTGHAGSMATIHANAPEDALVRLEGLALLAAPGLSVEAARRQVACAVEVVVHLERDAEGRRRVARVAEVRVGVRRRAPDAAGRIADATGPVAAVEEADGQVAT